MPTISNDEADCITDSILDRGYDPTLAPVECAAAGRTEPGCNACMNELGVSDGDCADVALECI